MSTTPPPYATPWTGSRRSAGSRAWCSAAARRSSGAARSPDHYGRPVEVEPHTALPRLAPDAVAVVDLADEPVLPAVRQARAGRAGPAPGSRLRGPRPAAHPAALRAGGLARAQAGGDRHRQAHGQDGGGVPLGRAPARRGLDPVIVCMGRGGPPEPRTARAGIGLIELLDIDSRGEHAASDYLEDAALAGVPTVGCRRVGGGLAGEPAESNVVEGAAMAAAMDPGALLFEGSGSCIPPVEVDRTVCVVGAGPLEPMAEYRLLQGGSRAGRGGRPRPAGRASPAPASRARRAAAGGREGGALHHRRDLVRGSGPGAGVHQPGPARRPGRGPRPGGRGGLRRLPHGAEGGRDRHRGPACPGRGRPRRLRAQPPGRHRRRAAGPTAA